MKVTLNDIADQLGVSTATVSRALNNQGRIGAATREAVITKAMEMGYELPDRIKSSGKMVGVVFDRRLQSLVTDPFYSTVMMGVEKGCKIHNSQVFFHTIDPESDDRLRSLFAENRLHGLIIVGGDIKGDFVERLRRQKIPFVLVDNYLDSADCIVSDNAGGVQKTLYHLLELGHTNIGFVGGPLSHPSILERYEAYRTMLLRHGIDPKPEWIWIHSEPGPCVSKGYEAIQDWYGSGLEMTALVTDNDSTAIGVLRGCTELGIRVPEDLSVVGFDNISLAEHVTPGITSVHIDKIKMGEWAAKRLHELMEKEDVPVRVVISTELVLRGSSGPNLKGDEGTAD